MILYRKYTKKKKITFDLELIQFHVSNKNFNFFSIPKKLFDSLSVQRISPLYDCDIEGLSEYSARCSA